MNTNQKTQQQEKTALSRRLALLADFLPELTSLADIGTDHAGLLAALVKSGKIQKGIGVEVVEGPYRRALANVEALGLTGSIEIRKGDGLKPLVPGEVMAAAIAGMGGGTILEILAGSPAVVASLSYLLLQPMTQAGQVRVYLQEQGWQIVKEAILEERGILYQIILAQPGVMKPLSSLEAQYGPLLLAENPPLLAVAVQQRLEGLRRVLGQLSKSDSPLSHEKKLRCQEQIKEGEALLQCLIPAEKSVNESMNTPRLI
ncbi:MAG: class I SAM-dependent methyltransferase [Clostridiales bacterium]